MSDSTVPQSQDGILRIEYIPLAQLLLLDDNPKLHDLGALIDSIGRYGFKDPPKFEPTLNGGSGGVVEGNGRTQALRWMQKQGRDVPRGIALAEDGDWAVPVLFGVDAESEAAAKAYSLDHNNLTLAGGDLTAFDYTRMYSADYVTFLDALAQADQLPVSIDGDTLDTLRFLSDETFVGEEIPDLAGWEEPAKDHRLIVQCASEGQLERLAMHLGLEWKSGRVRFHFRDTTLATEEDQETESDVDAQVAPRLADDSPL